MTEIDFIQSHLLNLVLQAATININIERTREEGEPYTITGLTATVEPKLEQSQLSNLKNVLEQVEVIKFNIENTQFTLEVTDRTYYNPTGGLQFYYLRVEDFDIPEDFYEAFDTTLNTSEEEQNKIYENTSIVFEPFITNLQFGFSEFNATISNAIDARVSTRIVESDRNTSTILPSNFNAIVSGTATAAEIQDSIYEETGWANARYEGTKTTANTFGNIPPTINGTLFPGEQYTLNTSASAIFEAPYESRVVEEFFYSGETRLPKLQFNQYNFGNESPEIIGQLNGQNGGVNSQTTNNTVGITYTNPDIAKLKPGDVITASDQTIPFVVVNVSEPNQSNQSDLTISGNYKNYQINSDMAADAEIRVFSSKNRIYNFIGETAKVEAASDVKIWIQEENEIVATNEAGTVIYIQKQLQGV